MSVFDVYRQRNVQLSTTKRRGEGKNRGTTEDEIEQKNEEGKGKEQKNDEEKGKEQERRGERKRTVE